MIPGSGRSPGEGNGDPKRTILYIKILKKLSAMYVFIKNKNSEKNYKLKKNTAPIHQPAGPLIKISKVKESQRVGCY